MCLICCSCRFAAQKLFSRQSTTLLLPRIAAVFEARGEGQRRDVHKDHRKHLSLGLVLVARSTKTQTGQSWNYTATAHRMYCEKSTAKAQQPKGGSTIDKKEICHFSDLSELWWDEAGEFDALHSMNEIRVPLIRDALVSQRQQLNPEEKVRPSRPLEGLKIVDVGSGGGILSEPLARLGASVVGVDASSENIKIAQAHLMHDPKITKNITYIQTTVEDLAASEAGKFDAVVASEVVEHVADVHTFVTACCQLVKPGGSIFMTTLNKTYLSYALGIVAAENVLRIVSPGTHDWNKFISPQDLQYILENNQFSTRLLHGMMYNPCTKRWSWIQNTSINYAIHAIKAVDDAETVTRNTKERNIKIEVNK